jgi:hypothetical protein
MRGEGWEKGRNLSGRDGIEFILRRMKNEMWRDFVIVIELTSNLQLMN